MPDYIHNEISGAVPSMARTGGGGGCWYSEERLLQTASLSPTLDTPDINITGYLLCFSQDLSPRCCSSHCGRKSGGFLWRSGDLQDEEVKADASKGVSAAARRSSASL